GTVIAAPPAGLRIIDNGDPGFSQTGNWANVSNYGFDNDALAGNGINGAETAQWVFSGLSAGSFYEVSATWLRGGDRAASVPYVVRDGLAGPILGTIVVDQTKNPNGPPENSRPFQLLDTFSITGNTLVVELSTQGTTKAVIADAILITDIRPPAGPELTLTEGGNTLPDGGRVSFGPAAEGATRPTRMFTIENTGGSDLILQPITVTGTGFTLESANFAPNSVVPAGGTASFTIGLSTATAGSFTGAVSFGNSDSDENPFELVLEGTISAAPDPNRHIIDNGDAGFSTTGNWANVTGYGYDGDALAGNGVNGVETAQWVFNGLIAGDYQVSTTWLRGSDREANVPYVIRDGVGGPILAVTTVNQKLEPVGNVFGGRRFQPLGTLTITGTTLVVELSTAGSTKAVIADAVRIERTSPPEAPLSIPVGSMVPIRPLSSLDWLFSSPEEDEESLFDVF
ncbi:MAG: choice-of-anchor D domain-containing protein, partial [Fuerstiella sp.]